MCSINSWPEYYNKGLCKSNFRMWCFSCNSIINRGDEITHCVEVIGMKLRPRTIIDNKGYKGFYTPYIGSRWVHKNCENTNGGWTQYSAMCFTKDYYNDYNDYDDSLEIDDNYFGSDDDYDDYDDY